MNHFIRSKFKSKLDIFCFFYFYCIFFYFPYANITNIIDQLYFIINFVGCIYIVYSNIISNNYVL